MNHRLGAAAVVAVSLVAALGSRQPTAGGYLVFGAGLALLNLAIYAGLAVSYRAISGARQQLRDEDGDGDRGGNGGDESGDGDDGNDVGDESEDEADGSESGDEAAGDDRNDDAHDPADAGDGDDARRTDAR